MARVAVSKDTSSSSMNILIKLMLVVSLVCAPLFRETGARGARNRLPAPGAHGIQL